MGGLTSQDNLQSMSLSKYTVEHPLYIIEALHGEAVCASLDEVFVH